MAYRETVQQFLLVYFVIIVKLCPVKRNFVKIIGLLKKMLFLRSNLVAKQPFTQFNCLFRMHNSPSKASINHQCLLFSTHLTESCCYPKGLFIAQNLNVCYSGGKLKN